jgi:hypothetical protein
VSARVVRWSKVASQMLSRRGPISPSRATKMLANSTGPDLFSSVVVVSIRPHLEHKGDLEKNAEIPER